MKVRISYTVEVDDNFRRALRFHGGGTGLATREEVRRHYEAVVAQSVAASLASARRRREEGSVMARRRPERLVHFITPYGSPGWMTRAEAERYLAEDDARWVRACRIERETGEQVLSDHQRAVGPPRIERGAD